MTGESLGLEHRFTPGDPALPVLLLLHGTGGTPDDLVPLVQHISPGSAVLAPAGPVSENGLARWFRRLAEGVFDFDDVVARTHQLADFVLEASEEYGLAERRMVAVGFSNGANIAAATLLLRPDALREGALFAAMLPLPEVPPVDLSRDRVLLSNGTHDPMAPISSTEQLIAALRERDADVSTHRHGGGHQVTIDGVQAAAAWLAKGAG